MEISEVIRVIFNELVKYFTDDPVNAIRNIFFSFGGFSGIWLIVHHWRERVRINIRIIKHKPFISTEEMAEKALLRVEVENIGGRATSLKPNVELIGYTPRRELRRYSGVVIGTDRELTPHKPQELLIEFPDCTEHFSLLFTKFVFRFTRGYRVRLFFLSVASDSVGPCPYYFHSMLFKYLGKILRDLC